MGFFSVNYNKPGPGIEKDAPKKKGLALFFDIYLRAFWELLKLNFIFILFCIPIVTIGPACAGMSRVTMLMMREKPFFVWGDFWKGFKGEFKQSFLAGIISLLLVAGLTMGVRFYLAAAEQNPVMYAAWFILLVVGFMACMSFIYIYPLIVTVALPFVTLCKNAMLLSIVCLKQSLPAIIAIFLLGLVMFLFLPYTVPVILVMFFSHVSFICSFAAWPGVHKYVATGLADESEN